MIEKDNLTQYFKTYNLTATVTFPTRSQDTSSTTIDNIFIDNSKISIYTVSPFFNGLSDHDAQLLTIKDINLQSQDHYVYTTRNINSYSINEFKISLSYETWDCVFSFNNDPDVDTLFNSFLTLKRPPGVKFDPSLCFFSITFLVYLTMTPNFVTLSRQVSSRSA